MASKKQAIPSDSRSFGERPAKRAKVDDERQASTSSAEPSNGMEDSITGEARLAEDEDEDEEGLEDEVEPGQSKNEPRASDLYLDTVRHSVKPFAHVFANNTLRSIEHCLTLTLRKYAPCLCQTSTRTAA
jgi:U4/U6.U5 tri-snRNP-associated protein 2